MAIHYVDDGIDTEDQVPVKRSYAWIVFALSFGLLISDYMSRQVLNAVFPLLKAEWSLSDTQLGSLSGVVALMVGLLTVPLSMLADRWGRVRSLSAMAILWSVATLACAHSTTFNQMFSFRFLVGIGEAAYGSVGVAVVLSMFPKNMRATLTSAFMAGGMAGSVLGIALGGSIAKMWGWRAAFEAMAMVGLVLGAIYPFVVREKGPKSQPKIMQSALPGGTSRRQHLTNLVTCPTLLAAYAGSGLQLFIAAALMAWIPSFMNRYYDMAPDRSSLVAALFILLCGVGMICCGMLSDRLCRVVQSRKIVLAIGCSAISCVFLLIGFSLAAGPLQLVFIGIGMFFVAGITGPSGAVLANLTHKTVHGTAFATMTLTNNLLGLAPGPILTGVLADRLGLSGALQVLPLMSLFVIVAFFVCWKRYHGDLERNAAETAVLVSA